jgi:membrane associated rhomboid family serine protease
MRYTANRYDSPASFVLAAVMGVCFVLNFFLGNKLAAFLAWQPSIDWLRSGMYWQPITFPFAQVSVLQVLFDAMLLVFIGSSLERAWGTGKFLFFFFASGILAGLVLLPATATIGFTPFFYGMVGSFSAIAVAFAAMNPYATLIFFVFPLQARWWAAIIVAWDLFGNDQLYGGPLQALIAISVVAVFAYLFTTRRPSLPTLGTSSLKDRYDRWQQRRRMRNWQRRVSKIDRPDDLFKDK